MLEPFPYLLPDIVGRWSCTRSADVAVVVDTAPSVQNPAFFRQSDDSGLVVTMRVSCPVPIVTEMSPILVTVDVEPPPFSQGLANFLVGVTNDFVTHFPVLLGFICQVLGFAGNGDYLTARRADSI